MRQMRMEKENSKEYTKALPEIPFSEIIIVNQKKRSKNKFSYQR